MGLSVYSFVVVCSPVGTGVQPGLGAWGSHRLRDSAHLCSVCECVSVFWAGSNPRRHLWPGPGLTPGHRVVPFDASGWPSDRLGSLCCVQRILRESSKELPRHCRSWLWVRKVPLKEQKATAAAGTSPSWGCSDYQMVEGSLGSST